MNLTKAQKQAVNTVGKNICVSAGAGTGKTRVLVERFLHLVEKGNAHVDQILAITFTEKAAQEMKERIAKRFREKNMESARRALENAYIGTIHSFCARLLREHPIEARVDPKFRILEDMEATLLKSKVLDELIESRFQEPRVFELLHLYSENGLRTNLVEASNHMRVLGMKGTDELIKKPSLESELFLRTQVIQATSPFRLVKEKKSDVDDIERMIEEPIRTWAQVEGLQSLRKRFRKQGKTKEFVEPFREALDAWVAYGIDQIAQPYLETFVILLHDFNERFEAQKREASVLDFNDLEIKAHQLLSGSESSSRAVRDLYQTQFKFVMVDEFQDTSALQNEIITFVTQKENLFIVGDWKQSIYGFRGTDVSLFFKKAEAFSQGEENLSVSLVDNFRSRKEVLDFINPLFEGLWHEETKLFDRLNASVGFEKKETPSIEFVSVEQGEREVLEAGRMREARALAERIQELVASGAYRYEDFALLFRVGTDIYFYEHELKNLHIPFYTISGRGFYHQPEVRDLICFLELIENPNLDIPLASVLRSPLVQVSDDTLFWLAQTAKREQRETPLFKSLRICHKVAEISSEDQEKLEHFKALLNHLIEGKRERRVSEMLELILKDTGYDAYVLGLHQGKRHFANLSKLLEIARDSEGGNIAHLGDFVRLVKGLQVEEARELEAQIEAQEGKVVKLMTIHKAKGLEFKVVVLPDLSRQTGKNLERILVDPELGFGIKILNTETRAFEEGLTYRKIKSKIREREEAESKRLLYVAMTRARDHLIFSGTVPSQVKALTTRTKPTQTWYRWIDQFVHTLNDESVLKCKAQDPLYQAKRVPTPLAEHKNIRQALESGSFISASLDSDAERLLQRIKPVDVISFDRLDLPVSAYLSFEHDMVSYLASYELGGPTEQDKIEEWNSDEDESALSPTEFGNVTHNIFEHLVVLPKVSAHRTRDILTRYSGSLIASDQKEMKRLTESFLQSTLFSALSRAKAKFPEIPFVLRLEKGMVQGILDLLYQDQDGAWVILDYKTNRITELELERTAKSYELQMMFYALACHELLKINVDRATLYFARLNQTFDFPLADVHFGTLRTRCEELQTAIINQRRQWQAT
jgi:ATP-dependent helicase/nuclease subunit A